MKTIFRGISDIKHAVPKGKTITLVGGSFDLLHIGHLHLLKYAASLEDFLVVAVHSDAFIKKYKGSGRPIINQNQRLEMVANVRCVDFAYLSDVSPSSLKTLKLLKPDSVVFEQKSRGTKKLARRIKNISIASPKTKVVSAKI